CVQRPARGRAAWAQVGRCGFRQLGDQSFTLCGQAENHLLQDRGISQTDSSRSGIGRGASELAEASAIPASGRLGIRQPTQKGQTTILARGSISGALQAGVGCSPNTRRRGLAYVSPYVWHSDEGEWRGYEDDSGTPAPRQLQGHSRHVYAGSNTNEASSTNQAGKDVLASESGGRLAGMSRSVLNEPFQTLGINRQIAQLVWNLGVPDGI